MAEERRAGPAADTVRLGGTAAARLRLLIESIHDYAVFMLEPDGRVATWNAGAERIKGYKAEEIIGKSFTTFYPDEDDSHS